jgi:hypothetical protein
MQMGPENQKSSVKAVEIKFQLADVWVQNEKKKVRENCQYIG